ncbi:hypothetical protein BJK05_07315 [Pectobacterium polaris]|nr:hypothetical protein BJK05_07315 [Pectobacterium polaris]
MLLSKIFSITAHSAQLLAHFMVEITFCAMDAVFSRGLRNFLLKFCLGRILVKKINIKNNKIKIGIRIAIRDVKLLITFNNKEQDYANSMLYQHRR